MRIGQLKGNLPSGGKQTPAINIYHASTRTARKFEAILTTTTNNDSNNNNNKYVLNVIQTINKYIYLTDNLHINTWYLRKTLFIVLVVTPPEWALSSPTPQTQLLLPSPEPLPPGVGKNGCWLPLSHLQHGSTAPTPLDLAPGSISESFHVPPATSASVSPDRLWVRSIKEEQEDRGAPGGVFARTPLLCVYKERPI